MRFFKRRLIDKVRSSIVSDWQTNLRRCFMKRILSILAASIALFTAAGAAQGADAQQASSCQGPASQCNVFFGQ